MPSPTPPREVRCEACGSSYQHSPDKPIPVNAWMTRFEAVRYTMMVYCSCVPGCTGCLSKATR
jgi:hypothetical protein